MSIIQEKNYSAMKSFAERNRWTFTEKVEHKCKRIDVVCGIVTNVIKVYETGTIQIQGPGGKLSESLNEAKKSVEAGESIGEILPFEIEKFPQLLQERIPGIDPVIVRFVSEAIITVKAGSNLGCAFLLGGASEKAFLSLMDLYCNSFEDQAHAEAFRKRTSNKFISKIYDEFKQSFKSSINKPTGYGWSNDIEVKIEQIFQFCRICRNEAGHPHLPPNLDKGVLLANMGQFVKYIEDIYGLMEYYKNNKVKL